MLGPLDRESVVGMLSRGEVSEHDLAQRDGVEVWIPLRRLFPPPPKPTRIALAWDFARDWAMKFWTVLHLDPLRVGVASLLVGCTLIIFPRWTFLLFVPALVAAVFAGALLLTRRRFLTGVSLSFSALIFPPLFLLAGRDDTLPALPFQLLASPSIESVVPPKPPVPVKPAPLQSLGGVALPLPVQPTPTPLPSPPI
ncbi:MAG: hypothetical protein ABIZ56_08270 [Chthoniobacteraceae bacterium]